MTSDALNLSAVRKILPSVPDSSSENVFEDALAWALWLQRWGHVHEARIVVNELDRVCAVAEDEAEKKRQRAEAAREEEARRARELDAQRIRDAEARRSREEETKRARDSAVRKMKPVGATSPPVPVGGGIPPPSLKPVTPVAAPISQRHSILTYAQPQHHPSTATIAPPSLVASKGLESSSLGHRDNSSPISGTKLAPPAGATTLRSPFPSHAEEPVNPPVLRPLKGPTAEISSVPSSGAAPPVLKVAAPTAPSPAYAIPALDGGMPLNGPQSLSSAPPPPALPPTWTAAVAPLRSPFPTYAVPFNPYTTRGGTTRHPS